jgi:hypothetical protein
VTLQFRVTAPGVMDDDVRLQTLKLTVSAVGYGKMVSIPVVTGAYPVTPVMSAFDVT